MTRDQQKAVCGFSADPASFMRRLWRCCGAAWDDPGTGRAGPGGCAGSAAPVSRARTRAAAPRPPAPTGRGRTPPPTPRWSRRRAGSPVGCRASPGRPPAARPARPPRPATAASGCAGPPAGGSVRRACRPAAPPGSGPAARPRSAPGKKKMATQPRLTSNRTTAQLPEDERNLPQHIRCVHRSAPHHQMGQLTVKPSHLEGSIRP